MQKKVVCYSHIPQETFTKNWGTKRKNKDEGVHTGVPDYIIVTPYNLVFIELKRKKGGTVSQEQKDWILALNSIYDDESVKARVCKGFDEAKAFLEAVMEI